MSRGGESKDGGDGSGLPGWANVNFDEIEISDRIGGGGVGVVYKGYWRNKTVALKTLFDARIGQDLKQEYMDELLVMSKVKHSNIVEFMGACMIDVGSAMEYLHSLTPAIIHRDLKTLNILRASNGQYKLCDFGLVKVKSATAGTPAYMAPELIENRPFNKSVDVYAFGVLLWEIFSAEIPFYMTDITEIRNKVVAGGRPRVPSYGFSPKVSRLVQQCWDQTASARPDFPSVVDALYEIEKDVPDTIHSENVKDNGGDILDGLCSGGAGGGGNGGAYSHK
eukprot:gene30465-37683_t